MCTIYVCVLVRDDEIKMFNQSVDNKHDSVRNFIMVLGDGLQMKLSWQTHRQLIISEY